MLDAARAAGVPFEERAVPEPELHSADEVLILSSRRFVSGVTWLDGATVGDGTPGPVCRALFAAMRAKLCPG
jgi:D-alanine transaminase